MDLRSYIEGRLKELDETFVPGTSRIPLSCPTFGADEILESLDSLVTAKVTIGEKVRMFERDFARYCGVRWAACLNSGSSANLLAFAILANPETLEHLKRNDEVVVPAVSWSTTVFPIMDVGLIPVLVDVDIDTLNLDQGELDSAISDRTGAIFPVHLLGNPADMDGILDAAAANDSYVVEDACEAHGASIRGAKVGSFGDLATFSFYFSHHISTIEGGMLVSDHDEYIELAKALRAHGYVRDLRNADEIARRYPDIDSRFLFVNRGFNLRPTEIQGAFGIHQLPKLDWFIERRTENAQYFRKQLAEYGSFLRFQTVLPGARHVHLGFSIVVSPTAPFSKHDLVEFLESKKIETRPIVAGNIAEQPAMSKLPHRIRGSLRNAKLVMRNGFYFGVHHGIGSRHRDYIVDQFDAFMKQHS